MGRPSASGIHRSYPPWLGATAVRGSSTPGDLARPRLGRHTAHGEALLPICNANAVMTCPHQTGMVMAVPTQATVLVGGAPALRATDVTTWAVAPGCTQLPTPATPAFVPCAKVMGLGAGASTRVLIAGQPALLATATLVTNGLPVPTPGLVVSPGQTVVLSAG